MTPTLFGRWQTRLLLLATVGVLVSLPFAVGWIGSSANSVYFWILGYVAIFGLGWDMLYNLVIMAVITTLMASPLIAFLLQGTSYEKYSA